MDLEQVYADLRTAHLTLVAYQERRGYAPDLLDVQGYLVKTIMELERERHDAV